jgi:hypothetical protein
MSDEPSNEDKGHVNQNDLQDANVADSTNQGRAPDLEETGCAAQQGLIPAAAPPSKVWEPIKNGWEWIKRPESTNLIMALATVVIAVFTALTFYLVLDSSKDTQKLISAAQTQATASQDVANAASDQADAAQQFSDTAEEINGSMSNAVQKLNLQAGELGKSVRQAGRLAKATEQSNANVINADRPWMGGTLTVDGFAAGSTPTYIITFTNSGKRPARVTRTETLSAPLDFGENPVYRHYDTTPSISFVVPGQSVVASWKDEILMNPIPETRMQELTSGVIPFRVYGRVEYTDTRTGSLYWTHVCWRYTPTHTAVNAGFSNCTEYNDAK